MLLNRNKPYATIIGQSESGAMFQQDGQDFDNHGELVATEKPFVVSEPSSLGVELPEPVEDLLPELEPVKEPETMVLNAPDVKQWTKTAVINHMKMKFPGVYVNENEKIFVLKNQLRALYATD